MRRPPVSFILTGGANAFIHNFLQSLTPGGARETGPNSDDRNFGTDARPDAVAHARSDDVAHARSDDVAHSRSDNVAHAWSNVRPDAIADICTRHFGTDARSDDVAHARSDDVAHSWCNTRSYVRPDAIAHICTRHFGTDARSDDVAYARSDLKSNYQGNDRKPHDQSNDAADR